MISSHANSQVKQIRKLRERKERQQTGLFYVEGLRIVAEALQLGAPIQELVYSPDLLVSEFGRQLVRQASQQGIALLEVTGDVFQSIAQKDGPQGIGAVIHQQWAPLDQIRPGETDTWVALDAVADPGNLGTILRTNDAVCGAGVILLDQSTDPYDLTAVRASMGALFAQKLARASFEQFEHWVKEQGLPVTGTSDSAQLDYHACVYPGRMVLLMGSERQGLKPHHLKLCDQVVRIPMYGRGDSLNLAVATAVMLYELFNQRREKAPDHEE
ncbi:MAG: RNA methyltransferase [Chloroflexi bacterium]|nr:RNA methyltransferase [Chloroflexota bacterium]